MRSPTTGQPFAIMTPSGPRWTGKVELIEHMLDVPLRRKVPTVYFANSMSDLFHEDLPDADIDRVWQVMLDAPQHRYMILTKRAQRMQTYLTSTTVGGRAAYGPNVPDWIWLGVSVEDRARLGRIDLLRQTPAAIRFLSLEPLLEDLGDISRYLRGIDWAIVGGESGPGARPLDIAWVRSIVAQCKAADVACFVKQLGAKPMYPPETILHPPRSRIFHPKDRKGGSMEEWPQDLRVRQMPYRNDPTHKEPA